MLICSAMPAIVTDFAGSCVVSRFGRCSARSSCKNSSHWLASGPFSGLRNWCLRLCALWQPVSASQTVTLTNCCAQHLFHVLAAVSDYAVNMLHTTGDSKVSSGRDGWSVLHSATEQ